MMEPEAHCRLCNEYFGDEEMLRRHRRMSQKHLTRMKEVARHTPGPASTTGDKKPHVTGKDAGSSKTKPPRSKPPPSSESSVPDVGPFFKMEAPIKSEDDEEDDETDYYGLLGGSSRSFAATPARTGLDRRPNPQPRDGSSGDVKPPISNDHLSSDQRPLVAAYASSSDTSNTASTRSLLHEPDSTSPTPPTSTGLKLEAAGDLSYTPQEAVLHEVKPAIVSCSSSNQEKKLTPTQRDVEKKVRGESSSRQTSSENQLKKTISAAADSSTCEAGDSKPALVSAATDDDDDGDVVIENVSAGRLRGGHDSGTEFRRPDGEPLPQSPSPSPPPPSPPPEERPQISPLVVELDDDDDDDEDDDDLVVEAPAPAAPSSGLEGRHAKDFCKFCNIKILNEKHWQRHKNYASHLANERNNHDYENYDGENGGYEDEYYDGDNDDQFSYNEDSWAPGSIVDPMFGPVAPKMSAQVYNCSHCNVNCTGIECYTNHMKGQKHRKKMNEKRLTDHPETYATRELEAQFMADADEPYVGLTLILEFKYQDDVRYNCQLCTEATLTRLDLQSHIKSWEHRKKFIQEFSPSSLRPLNFYTRDSGDSRLAAQVRRYRDAAKKALKRMNLPFSSGIVKIGDEHSEDLKRIIKRNKENQITSRKDNSSSASQTIITNEKKLSPKVDLNYRRSTPDDDSLSCDSSPDPHFVKSIQSLKKNISDDYQTANGSSRGESSSGRNARDKDKRRDRNEDDRRRRRDDVDDDSPRRKSTSRRNRDGRSRNDGSVKNERRSRSRSRSSSRTPKKRKRSRSRSGGRDGKGRKKTPPRSYSRPNSPFRKERDASRARRSLSTSDSD